MAKFQEVTPFSGVDESATPTGIVVPLGPGRGKFNIVRLTDGRGIKPRPLPGSPIKIDEITGADALMRAAVTFGGSIVPPLSMDRTFLISGIVSGTNFQVQAMDPRGFALDTLQIAVLKPRPVKLSIRPIQVRSPQGGLVYHSKVSFDANAMVDQMNSIWTPQANVVFTLVSSNPAQVIDEAKIGNLLGKSLGPAFQGPAPLPETVNIHVLKDLLIENVDKNADLTMFLVQSCSKGETGNTLSVHGVTDWGPGWAFSLIGDWRAKEPALMAHEAGHFLGNMRDHTDDADDDKGDPKDKRRQLMVNGGATLVNSDGSAGYKLIPFDLAIKRFNPQ
jgi:hypothetical protein